MRRWRNASGQATSEYVALVALVAVVLALAAGLTSGGVGGQVLAGLQRGLCEVADVRCPAPHRPRDELDPCPVERTTRSESLQGALEVVKLGDGAALSSVRLSDGRVQVTLADIATDGGGIGLGFSVGLGRRHGAAVTLEIERSFATGRLWNLPDVASARAFVKRYGTKATIGGKAVDVARSGCSILCDAVGWRPHAALPPADETSIDLGFGGRLSGTLGSAGLETSSDHMLGIRVQRDGGRTVSLGFDGAAGAALLSSAGLGVEGQRQTVVSFTVDARERPVALSIATVVGDAALATLQAAGSHTSASVGATVAHATELEATLDLRDARNRAAAVAFRAALRDPLEVARLQRSASALGRRIAGTGVINRRTYALSSSGFALGGKVTLGTQLGGGFERTHEGMQLLSAETRLPGLPFLPRDDCRPT